MWATVGRWLVLASCILAAASAAQDNVLRFVNNKEAVRMALQKHSDEIKVSDSGFKGALPMEKEKESPAALTLSMAGILGSAFRQREKNVMTVKCPDGSQCDNGNTCCPLLDGKYGCCPYLHAVCCKDRKHCCPNGYTCDLAAQTCNMNATAVPSLVQKPAISKVQSVICPDHKSQCPDGSTCCKLNSGEYGCCPLPNAVCCSDGIHCCPEGSTCDLAEQTCKKGQEFIPWVEKVPSPKKVQSVICPDGQSECLDGNTCCKLSSGQYGCCPLPDAVCCSDGVHCCPQNTTCNLAQQKCDSGHYSIPWEKKLPARHSLP